MKFSCEQCGTRYSIADEKVEGKRLRIRCKVCSFIMDVRGSQRSGVAATPVQRAQPQQTPAVRQEEWFAAQGSDPIGPMSFEALCRDIKAHRFSRDVLVWNENFSDWKPATAVPELARLLPPPLPESEAMQPAPSESATHAAIGEAETLTTNSDAQVDGSHMAPAASSSISFDDASVDESSDSVVEDLSISDMESLSTDAMGLDNRALVDSEIYTPAAESTYPSEDQSADSRSESTEDSLLDIDSVVGPAGSVSNVVPDEPPSAAIDRERTAVLSAEQLDEMGSKGSADVMQSAEPTPDVRENQPDDLNEAPLDAIESDAESVGGQGSNLGLLEPPESASAIESDRNTVVASMAEDAAIAAESQPSAEVVSDVQPTDLPVSTDVGVDANIEVAKTQGPDSESAAPFALPKTAPTAPEKSSSSAGIAVVIAVIGLVGVGVWLSQDGGKTRPKVTKRSQPVVVKPIATSKPSQAEKLAQDNSVEATVSKNQPAVSSKAKTIPADKTQQAKSNDTLKSPQASIAKNKLKPKPPQVAPSKAQSVASNKAQPTKKLKAKTASNVDRAKLEQEETTKSGGKTSLLAALQMDQDDDELDVTKLGPMEGARIQKGQAAQKTRADRLMDGNALEDFKAKDQTRLNERKLEVGSERTRLLDLPEEASAGGTSEEFPRDEVNRIFNRESRAVSDCYKRHLTKGGRPFRKNVTLSFRIEPAGKASGVSIGSKYRRTYMKKCLGRLVGRLKFPPFKGKSETVEFPLKIATRY